MPTHPVSDPDTIWNDIFKNKVEKDDPLWQEYVEKAATSDERMVDNWNKIVDVILVYVALFISVLTSFVIQTSSQLQKDPAAITNDLLVVIYKQLAAQANNTPIPLVDTDSLFNQDNWDHDNAVATNALLYTSIALCIVVSVIALAAKLWLVSYSDRVFSVGLPYERAMKRQRAYSGVVAWKMGAVINAMPLMLLAVLLIFGFFIYYQTFPLADIFSFVVGSILSLGFISFGATSIGAAFVPACPFRSVFSSAMALLFDILQTFFQTILYGMLGLKKETSRWLWMGFLAISGLAFGVVTPYATQQISNHWIVLSFVPSVFALAYAAQQKVDHATQDYQIPYLMGCVMLIVESLIVAAVSFARRWIFTPFQIMYSLAMVVLVLYGWMSSGMSKSMAKTGEIDAMAWLLRSTSSQDPTFFKKAGQLVSLPADYNDGLPKEYRSSQYRPRLLKSLMPLLSLLITSYRAPQESSPDPSPLSKGMPEFSEEDIKLGKAHFEGLPTSHSPEVQANSVVKTLHYLPRHSNTDPSFLLSHARPRLVKEKNIKLNKLRFDLPTSLSPVQTNPAASASHHVPNSNPSSPSPKAMPEVLEERNINPYTQQSEGLPIASLNPVEVDESVPTVTSHHIPKHFNPDPSSPSSEARPKLVEKKNARSKSLPVVLSPMKADDLHTINEEMKALQHLEIYVACLALLSDFEDYQGSFRCLWEDAKQHAKLEEELRNKLVELVNPSYPFSLRSAAIQVLKNYGLDSQGVGIDDLDVKAHTRLKRWGFTFSRGVRTDAAMKLLPLT